MRSLGLSAQLVILLSSVVALSSALSLVPLRLLSINVGNAGLKCWESKLCVPSVVASIRSYISTYSPDVILLAEVMQAAQMVGTADGGPLLPPGYVYTCDESVYRNGTVAAWNGTGASHEHECVAWNASRLKQAGEAVMLGGLNNTYGQAHCNYDFTAHAVTLQVAGVAEAITFIAVHPDSQVSACRVPEIASYWSYALNLSNPNSMSGSFVIGGDWNAGRRCYALVCEDTSDELQVPMAQGVVTACSNGQYWSLHNDTDSDSSPTAVYLDGVVRDWLDHVYVRGAAMAGPCTSCGAYYGTASLPWGAVVGGYDDMPRADGGSGCDHRQLLIDMWLNP